MKTGFVITLSLLALAMIGCSSDQSTATRSVPADQVTKKSGVMVGKPAGVTSGGTAPGATTGQ